MMALQALVLITALSNPGETVLLEFTTNGCAPCQAMQPVVQRLKREGLPVRQINIAADRQLAARFRVYQVPCFVMVVNGREVQRVVGATTYSRLVSMIRSGTQKPGPAPGPAVQPRVVSLQQPAPLPIKTLVHQTSAQRANGVKGSLSPQQRALQATVRLRVEDPRGTSYGTGTVIDTHGGDALVLTCGHIFRDSQGAGTIHVDLFRQGKVQTVQGDLIAYDAQRDDIGLVSIRPGIDVVSVAVAPASLRTGRGDKVFAVGCNRGAGPTVLSSQITGVNRFLGSANFTVQGRPLDGRSGGGLFTADGQLIGLCKWAVTDADEGVYAGLLAVHGQLAKAGLQSLFEVAAVGDSQVTPATAISGDPLPSGLSTLTAAPRPTRIEASAPTSSAVDARQAEYAAKLQALERAYEISRESLRQEYQQSLPSSPPTVILGQSVGP